MLVELLGILRWCREAGGRAYGGGMATAAPTSSGVWERVKERGIWRAARVQPGHGCPCRSMGRRGRPQDGQRVAIRVMDAGVASTVTVNRGREGMARGWAS